MKVLFAVSNDKISEQISRKFQQDYKEIISSKNVYYFNAIINELQKNKSYDRIVISEDLEMFSTNNYQEIDKFIFEKLDNISDEAVNNSGADIPIILICTDRRNKMDPLMLKFFGIGIYSALLGSDRSIQKVSDLIYKPRSKKEAKAYYRVESSEIEYKSEKDDNGVSETEIKNILMHYRKIGNNPVKCAESFRKIVGQYTEEQVKLIIPFLTSETKKILEHNSEEYLRLIGRDSSKMKNTSTNVIEPEKKNYFEKEINSKSKLNNPVIIPTQINTNRVKKSAELITKGISTTDKLADERAKRIAEKKARLIAERKAEEERLKKEAQEEERRARAQKIRLESERKAKEERMRMEKIRKQEEERIKKEAEAEKIRREEARKAEQERKRKIEQQRLRKEAERKAEEERKKIEAEKKAEEERKRKEAARKAEEERKRKEAARKAEEERKRKEAARKAEEERKRIEAEKKAEEERKRKEAERKAEEERKRKEEEERLRKEAEKKIEEKLRKEFEAKLAETEKLRKQAENKVIEQEKLRKQAEDKVIEHEKLRKQAEQKATEEENLRKQAEKKAEEEKIKQAAKNAEQERLRKIAAEKAEEEKLEKENQEIKRRGRPRKNVENVEKVSNTESDAPKKGRGRPRKEIAEKNDNIKKEIKETTKDEDIFGEFEEIDSSFDGDFGEIDNTDKKVKNANEDFEDETEEMLPGTYEDDEDIDDSDLEDDDSEDFEDDEDIDDSDLEEDSEDFEDDEDIDDSDLEEDSEDFEDDEDIDESDLEEEDSEDFEDDEEIDESDLEEDEEDFEDDEEIDESELEEDDEDIDDSDLEEDSEDFEDDEDIDDSDLEEEDFDEDEEIDASDLEDEDEEFEDEDNFDDESDLEDDEEDFEDDFDEEEIDESDLDENEEEIDESDLDENDENLEEEFEDDFEDEFLGEDEFDELEDNLPKVPRKSEKPIENTKLIDLEDEEEKLEDEDDFLDDDDDDELSGIMLNDNENSKSKVQDNKEDENLLPLFDDEEDDEDNLLPSFDEEDEEDDEIDDEEEDDDIHNFEDDSKEEVLEENDEDEDLLNEILNQETEEIKNPNYKSIAMEDDSITAPNILGFEDEEEQDEIQNNEEKTIPPVATTKDLSIDNLITGDKKIVSFVGTTKNGTSFIVNNLAKMFSEKGVKTAILDLTKNRNAYYIYTENEEELRKKAYTSLENLRKGIADGIEVNKNLTVYTSLPGETQALSDTNNILETLLNNYSLILLDCDFETEPLYFKASQETYLVQTFDVLTIQPLTAFLRDLKLKNILEPEKLRIIINKNVKVNGANEKILIGGMSVYNDPGMTYMTELFNRDKIKYVTIPFEEQIYSSYLECLIKCKISYKGSSKKFLTSLNQLGNMVFPLISGKKIKKNNKQLGEPKTSFPEDINETLNNMKKNR